MNENVFSHMERDVIGEVMNISLGSSATSLSELLGKRVEITVPQINVTAVSDFSYKNLEPAIGVEINYIEGLKGINLMIWKRTDAKTIIEILMGQKIDEDEFKMDEINRSAICEVMNQMMGSAATALSDFLSKPINISTPIAYEIEDNTEFKNKYFHEEDVIVAVSFELYIEDGMRSQFINVMPVPLAREIVSSFLREAEEHENEEIHETEKAYSAIEEKHIPVQQKEEHPEINKTKHIKTAQKKKESVPVNARPVEYASFDDEDNEESISGEQLSNLDLIMQVPLTISVEIGRASKPIKDILEFTSGTIVELDKQAGALVDVVVNGKLIAKGEVVVVNDNFGVRVVEIIKKDEIVRSL
jgi:flagellar motor switch protein FliN/FliY